MTDKVICPFCGAEMDVKSVEFKNDDGEYVWSAWTTCRNVECGVEGPYGVYRGAVTEKEAIEAARAAALHRYTPPLKPMTWDEVQACDDDRPLFHERKGCSGFVRAWGNVAKAACQGFYNEREYGIEYRYWPDRKPTEEEREAAEWET